MKKTTPAKPIINVHTHIFTQFDVPPYLGKSILPFPLYWIASLPLIIFMYRGYKKLKRKWKSFIKKRAKIIGRIKSSLVQDFIFKAIIFGLLLVSVFLLISLFGIGGDWHDSLPEPVSKLVKGLYEQHSLLKIPVLVFASILSDPIRKLLIKLFTSLFVVFDWLPNNLTGMVKRYFLIARYADYKEQRTSFQKLYKMYPNGSRFVVLPMDMAYLGAGKPKRKYLDQLQDIYEYKKPKSTSDVPYDKLLPFIHVDPRRIERENHQKGHEPFFLWKAKNDGGIELEHCLMKRYLEGRFLEGDEEKEEKPRFCGIKIYPAQGYFPFDEQLLPLWLYCAERGIPITTHCSVGTIYYRGPIQNKWLTHPVFTQKGKPKEIPAETQSKLQVNFTHPLNYLVLLENEYLKRWLTKISKNSGTKTGESNFDVAELLNAFNFEKGKFKSLGKLKINLAHYGGSDQWDKYLESETEESNQEIIENPLKGLILLHNKKAAKAMENRTVDKDNPPYEQPSWIWDQNVDWYTIISSMMLQYKGVYSDISYTIHNEKIYPLLIQTLKNPRLKKKVLFGTDFYVVRNHKSEKALYNEVTAGLDKDDMDQIALTNSEMFLDYSVPE